MSPSSRSGRRSTRPESSTLPEFHQRKVTKRGAGGASSPKLSRPGTIRRDRSKRGRGRTRRSQRCTTTATRCPRRVPAHRAQPSRAHRNRATAWRSSCTCMCASMRFILAMRVMVLGMTDTIVRAYRAARLKNSTLAWRRRGSWKGGFISTRTEGELGGSHRIASACSNRTRGNREAPSAHRSGSFSTANTRVARRGSAPSNAPLPAHRSTMVRRASAGVRSEHTRWTTSAGVS